MKMPRAVKRCLFTLLAVLVFYVSSYCCLSACGSYQLTQSGRLRYGFGLSVSDLSIWQPTFLRWQRFSDTQAEETSRGNALGNFYCPMIILDRWLVHPDKWLFDSPLSST